MSKYAWRYARLLMDISTGVAVTCAVIQMALRRLACRYGWM